MPVIITNDKPMGVWKPVPLREQMAERGESIPDYYVNPGEKITLSSIKADVGSHTGHVQPHPKMLEKAEELLTQAIKDKLIIDGVVFRVGDDINLTMTHTRGTGDEKIHKLAFDTFVEAGKIAQEMSLYGAMQDILVSEFSGNVQGMGPGVAELEFILRKTEPVIVFAADKTSPYAFNRPLYNMFCSPYNSIGLAVDPKFFAGFKFQIKHLKTGADGFFVSPEERTAIKAFLGSEEYAIAYIYSRQVEDDPVAACSTTRLSFIAGKYVGKDDPVCIVRAQSGLPAVGEVVNAFHFPGLVPGGMRGSSLRPLMPCSIFNCDPTYNDGPPRVIGLGFQINKGEFIGPTDLLGDISFDESRRLALQIAEYMQRHGVFYPGILPDKELEYGGKPVIYKMYEDRFPEIYKKFRELEKKQTEAEAEFIKKADEVS